MNFSGMHWLLVGVINLVMVAELVSAEKALHQSVRKKVPDFSRHNEDAFLHKRRFRHFSTEFGYLMQESPSHSTLCEQKSFLRPSGYVLPF